MRRREKEGQGVGRGKAREHRSNSARESGTARGERNGKGRTQESGMAPEERVKTVSRGRNVARGQTDSTMERFRAGVGARRKAAGKGRIRRTESSSRGGGKKLFIMALIIGGLLIRSVEGAVQGVTPAPEPQRNQWGQIRSQRQHAQHLVQNGIPYSRAVTRLISDTPERMGGAQPTRTKSGRHHSE